MNRAAFLDRDGVINRKAPTPDQYITRWEEIQILPGAVEAIALLNQAGFRVIVVTNQRCVAHGLITVAELERLHKRLCDSLAGAGAIIDAVYFCPHELQPPCNCRKPQPGMLLEAARTHEIDLTVSWMIGDSNKDIEAGRNAGCKTAQLLSENETGNDNADVVAQSLLEATDQILRLEKNSADRRAMGTTQSHYGDSSTARGNCGR
ncbi:MAG: HAD family hydrolase [Candidatus Acidiferrales bacterium]